MIRQINPVNGPVCGVFAATLATPDMPFFMVKNMAQEEMQRQRWRGRMHMPALTSLLTRLGVTFKEVTGLKGVSLREANQRLAAHKHYIMFVTGHFMTLHNNVGYDQSNAQGTPIEKFWCAGRKVLHILEIDRTKPSPTYDELFPEEK